MTLGGCNQSTIKHQNQPREGSDVLSGQLLAVCVLCGQVLSCVGVTSPLWAGAVLDLPPFGNEPDRNTQRIRCIPNTANYHCQHGRPWTLIVHQHTATRGSPCITLALVFDYEFARFEKVHRHDKADERGMPSRAKPSQSESEPIQVGPIQRRAWPFLQKHVFLKVFEMSVTSTRWGTPTNFCNTKKVQWQS